MTLSRRDAEKGEIDWFSRTPEERLAEVERLREEETKRHREWPTRSKRNYVLNPAHPDFQRIVFGEAVPFAFDVRLLRTRFNLV